MLRKPVFSILGYVSDLSALGHGLSVLRHLRDLPVISHVKGRVSSRPSQGLVPYNCEASRHESSQQKTISSYPIDNFFP
ncbi:hypothetical protein Bpfe_022337 [Biomphalaria pfeifferi]|uniref:Uncharacterized protein n=1 Tax=Biomphalaria pfeifferi TaxID=112525 RepID=A0AAD8B5D6_BIOPF|nr:hypothetical protein Bpfe_022337 [Biomphalaria pfeifferi]